MSPVFGHGRLRLYLLKLLEESPRHGYEVIRLLQDRFLGVYSPSPGTIYPRLARLEEEGLVTHEVVDGKKVFTITDKGRAELRARMDELAELEQEITASVQDIARELKEDVRQTVRSLRQELTRMARNVGRDARNGAWTEIERELRRHGGQAQDEWRRQMEEWSRHTRRLRAEGERWQREFRRIWEEIWPPTGRPGPAPEDEFGRSLADFVARVHRDVCAGGITEEEQRRCQEILDEAARRIGETLRR